MVEYVRWMMTTTVAKGTWLLLPLILSSFVLLGGCQVRDKDLEAQKRQQEEQNRVWRTGLDSVLALGGEVSTGRLIEFSPQESTQDTYVDGKKVIEHKLTGSSDVLKAGYYRKVQRTIRLAGNEALPEYTANLTPDVVWPGNLIYANSVRGVTLQELTGLNDYRTPGRVTMAVVNGASNLSRQITDYRFSEVTKTLNELIASSQGAFPANLSYSVHAVRTLGEASYYLRIPEKQLREDKRYKAFQNVKWDINTFKAVISFSQDFFTLVYDDPNGGASGLFNTRLTPKKLGEYTSKGNPLAYISSVTYGRRFVAIIEETRRVYEDRTGMEQSVRTALPNNERIKDTSLGKTTGDGASHRDVSDLKDLTQIKIHIHLVGGKDVFSSSISSIPTMRELQRFLVETASEEQTKGYGYPVSCRIKYLHGLRTVYVPHGINSVYSFPDYELEQDDNKITVSGLRLEGRALSDKPTYGGYNLILTSACIVPYIHLGYSLDGVHEHVIPLLQDFKGSFLRGVNQALPSQTLPPFGVSPNGYIRISYEAKYLVNRGAKWGNITDITAVSFFRNIYFRYDPSTHKWYIDASESTDRDIPFRAIGNYSNEQYCPVELRLHYRISTELRGTLPHSEE